MSKLIWGHNQQQQTTGVALKCQFNVIYVVSNEHKI